MSLTSAITGIHRNAGAPARVKTLRDGHRTVTVRSPYDHRTVTVRSPLGKQSISRGSNQRIRNSNTLSFLMRAEMLCFPSGDRTVTVR